MSVFVDFTSAGVAVITISNPPVNALSAPVRSGLLLALQECLRRHHESPLRGAVITHAGRNIAGADINEFDAISQLSTPSLDLNDVMDAVERFPLPTVGAVCGSALGGGFELLLACRYRVLTADGRIGLPEVTLGIVPGAGGTQRLPRLVPDDVTSVIQMILTGQSINAKRALALGMVDAVCPSPGVDELRVFAEQFVLAQPRPAPAPLCNRALRYDGHVQAMLEGARDMARRRGRGALAPLACIDAVEAAYQARTFRDGLRREAELFFGLVNGEQSRALRALFFAERAKLPIGGGRCRDVRNVCIVGAGVMGCGIALSCLRAPALQVTVVDTSDEALARARSYIEKTAAKWLKGGAEAALARLQMTTQLGDACSGADLVIEAVFESIDAKRTVFEEVDRRAPPHCVLATNTSSLDVDEIAAFTRRPQAVVGMHFFSPAHLMPLLEVVDARGTDADVLATAALLGRKVLRKQVVVVKNCPGFVGNRLLFVQQHAIDEMMLRLAAAPTVGSTADEPRIDGRGFLRIDRVMEEFGAAGGPFKVSDVAGLDVAYLIRRGRGEPVGSSPVADELYRLGRLGQKSGSGFYKYAPDKPRKAVVDDAVPPIIEAAAHRLQLTPLVLTDQQIRMRALLPLVNESARIVAEGVVVRASDIDVTLCNGYGFPRHRGGPIHLADEVIGLGECVRALDELHQTTGDEYWRAHPLLRELAASGGKLRDYKTPWRTKTHSKL